MESSRGEAILATTRLLGALPGAVMRQLRASRPRAQVSRAYETAEQPGLVLSRESGEAYTGGAVVPVMTAAIHLLSMTIASLPRGVVDREGRMRLRHPITRLLNRDFPRWPAVALWDYLYRSALTYGIGYAYILRRDGVPWRLMPCSPLQSTSVNI